MICIHYFYEKLWIHIRKPYSSEKYYVLLYPKYLYFDIIRYNRQLILFIQSVKWYTQIYIYILDICYDKHLTHDSLPLLRRSLPTLLLLFMWFCHSYRFHWPSCCFDRSILRIQSLLRSPFYTCCGFMFSIATRRSAAAGDACGFGDSVSGAICSTTFSSRSWRQRSFLSSRPLYILCVHPHGAISYGAVVNLSLRTCSRWRWATGSRWCATSSCWQMPAACRVRAFYLLSSLLAPAERCSAVAGARAPHARQPGGGNRRRRAARDAGCTARELSAHAARTTTRLCMQGAGARRRPRASLLVRREWPHGPGANPVGRCAVSLHSLVVHTRWYNTIILYNFPDLMSSYIIDYHRTILLVFYFVKSLSLPLTKMLASCLYYVVHNW